MKNAIILHAMDDSPNNHWYPWLKSQLEQKGYDVWLPQLPDDKNPQISVWVPFIMESGKIVPSRISKLSSAQQKNVASAIRKARSLALLPNGTEAYDTFERPETISPKPFAID